VTWSSLIVKSGSSSAIRREPLLLVTLLMFAVLAGIHTWPLVSDVAHWSRIDSGDGALNTWAIAWVAHGLWTDPFHLFDANIFYPERLTLAYSESMIVQGAMALPVIALGGSAVLAYNLVLLAGLALTGWAFCLLTWRWTGSWSAGLLAGSLAAFNAHSLVQFAHLQLQHVEFVAVMLFALDRFVESRRLRHAALLAAGFVLQGLTSIYLLVFSVWTLIFAVASRARELFSAGAGTALTRLAAAGAVGLLVLSPYLYAYGRLHQLSGWTRGADEQQAATWKNYFATGGTFHYDLWSHRFTGEVTSYTFPGLVALVLVGVALTDQQNRCNRRLVMCLATAIGCLVVSFAARVPGYELLHRAIPLFQAVRVPAHLGHIVLLLLAIVAGFGIASIERRWNNRRTWPLVAAAVCILVNLEALRAPVGWTRFDGVPEVYAAIRDEPHAVVAELPFPIPSQWFLNGPYMVNSTGHWRPLLNGYSGFRPVSYERSYASVREFPADHSLISLHNLGVTHIIIHKQAYAAAVGLDEFTELSEVRSLKLVANDADVFIYRLEQP
jgi:hypothetical protein